MTVPTEPYIVEPCVTQKSGTQSTPHDSTQGVELDARWHQVLARDPAADGAFVFAVKTTGIYCRPSCPARRPSPANVDFYDSSTQAEDAGFRPCKRCKPNESQTQATAKIVEACRFIENSDGLPTLDLIAQHVGLSRHHFHRLFKQALGVTPRQYAVAQRNQRLRAQLDKGHSVTEAIFGAGYNASSRFYATSNKVLGMTPSRYRAGGANADIHFAVGECSLGNILVARSKKGICAILLGDDADALQRDLQARFPQGNLIGGDADFDQLLAAVVAFVEAPTGNFDLPLDVRGTAFQQRVWQALQDIPPGETASYTTIAARIGAPKAVRAVAGACAANALAVVVPCHRVVRSDGGLSGYRWGVERKRQLLACETEAEQKKEGKNQVTGG